MSTLLEFAETLKKLEQSAYKAGYTSGYADGIEFAMKRLGVLKDEVHKILVDPPTLKAVPAVSEAEPSTAATTGSPVPT